MIRYGWLHIEGWAGKTKTRIAIVDARPKTVTIRALERTKLGGRDKWLDVGHEAIVSRVAIEFDPVAE